MNNCVFARGNECDALKTKQCAGCSFCKTKEELIEGRQKAVDRINNLPEKVRKHIIHKYGRQRRCDNG